MQIYIDSSETHVGNTRAYVRTWAHMGACVRANLQVRPRPQIHLPFGLKRNMSVDCKMGPRCTPEIPGRRSRMRAVSSRAAGSPEFSLSSQAFLCDQDLNLGMVVPPGTVDQVGY